MSALAVVLAVAMLQTMPAGSSGMTTVEQGAQSNVDAARQVVVRSAAEWVKLWQEHGGDRKRPAVDFTKATVLGVFMGSRPTSGFRVEILDATPRDRRLVVRYREITPGQDTMSAQVITSAYHLVAVPAFAGEVTFEKVDPGR